MAEIDKVNVKITGDSKGLTNAVKEAVGSLNQLEAGEKRVGTSTIALGNIMASVAVKGFGALINVMRQSKQEYEDTSASLAKLATVMEMRGATQEQYDAVVKLTKAEEQLGVVSATAMQNGLQELATYVGKAQSLQDLTNVMNNLAVQQHGYNTSADNMLQTATMMGKVLQGQTGGMERIGYSIDEADKKIFQFGNEEQRVALLTEIVNGNLGNLNHRLGETDVGKQKQLAQTWGDLRVQIGALATVVGNTLAPVFSAVANAIMRVIAWVKALLKVFGISGGGATSTLASGFQTAGDSATAFGSDVGKAVKKANKALASFDEMNVLTEPTDSGSGGGGGGGVDILADMMPAESAIDWTSAFGDFDGMVDEMSAKWGGFFEVVKASLGNIAILLGTVFAMIGVAKIGQFINAIKSGFGGASGMVNGLILAIAGVILVVKNVWELFTQWEDLTQTEKVVKGVFAGIGVAVIALGVAIAAGFSAATLGIGAVIGLIIGAATAMAGWIFSSNEAYDSVRNLEEAENALAEATANLTTAYDDYYGAIDAVTNAEATLAEAEAQSGLSGQALYEQVKGGALSYKDLNAQQKEVFNAYNNLLGAQDKELQAEQALTEAKKAETLASLDNQIALAHESGEYDNIKQSIMEAYENGSISSEEARDRMEKAMSGMSADSKKTFMEDIPDDVKNGMDPNRYESAGTKFATWIGGIWDAVKQGAQKAFNFVRDNVVKPVVNTILGFVEGMVNAIIGGVEGMVNFFPKALETVCNGFLDLVNGIIKGINSLTEWIGISIPLVSARVNLGRVSLGRVSLPRMATGGIVTGATTALIGEAGREAVLPLENNTEWMDDLADKIGARAGAGQPLIVKIGEETILDTIVGGINDASGLRGQSVLNL